MTALWGALFPVLAAAHSPWLEEPAAQARLAAGEIIVRIDPDGQHVAAAVIIRASPEVVWKVITDCEGAPQYMPGMKSCRRLEAAPDGSWETIEREFRYSWLMPNAHDIVRTEYHKPERIDFQRLSGTFRDEQGAWLLGAGQDGASTLLEYQFYIDLGFWVPHSLVQHSLRNELPAAMKAVRTRAEATHATPSPP
jgi:Polyketide cyclase / dehydrase and lipid transport